MDNEKIGRSIRNHREEKGWTQFDLAKKIDRTPQAISSWESGRTIPNYSMILRLSEIFNCSKYELMGEDVAKAIEDFDNFMPDGKYDVFQEGDAIIARPTEPQIKIGGTSIDVNTAIAYTTKLNSLSDDDKRLVYSLIDRLSRG